MHKGDITKHLLLALLYHNLYDDRYQAKCLAQSIWTCIRALTRAEHSEGASHPIIDVKISPDVMGQELRLTPADPHKLVSSLQSEQSRKVCSMPVVMHWGLWCCAWPVERNEIGDLDMLTFHNRALSRQSDSSANGKTCRRTETACRTSAKSTKSQQYSL